MADKIKTGEFYLVMVNGMYLTKFDENYDIISGVAFSRRKEDAQKVKDADMAMALMQFTGGILIRKEMYIKETTIS